MNPKFVKFPRNVYLIAFSAFFADLGYQIVVGGLSPFLVIVLGAPVWFYGLIEALNYGIGSIFSYFGGRLADRFGAKKVSIFGNSLIPLLSFTGFPASYIASGLLFSGGWWARNSRAASRRTMLVESTEEGNSRRAFGLLHGLDTAGGLIAAILLIFLFYLGYELRIIFLLSILPLIISTILLVITKPTERKKREIKDSNIKPFRSAYLGILAATALFGFSSYSIGFTILTGVQEFSSITRGLFVFPVFLASTSATGFLFSRIKAANEIRYLGITGYIVSALGSFTIFLVVAFHLPPLIYFLGPSLLGLGVGAIETFEPTIVARVVSSEKTGTGLGTLSSFRSIGLFTGNLVMGVLYLFSSSYSYAYSTVVALIGGITVLYFGRKYAKV
ncbi:MAG: MFS transporter [Candidatus Thermoplasmatota archaeon]|nr:MFS transporter [Candidatus Thermoplasmatota archaeon]